MPQAWLVRGSERQEFLEWLMRTIYREHEKEEEQHLTFTWDRWCLSLIGVLARSMSSWHTVRVLGIMSPPEDTIENKTCILYNTVLVPAIRAFGRTATEEGFLLAQLFHRLAESAEHPFYRDLQRNEIENPQAILHAPSATAEVELPAE